ncbi:MAG: hypothetical protein PHI01_05540, partial [Candidatus Izemoplasmatales bacterium]|nr:hypothetical protein [Candidatus Izemoplasmatales bacterium]
IAILFAALMEFITWVVRKKPKLTRAMAKISGDGHYYSSAKAIRELGYSQSNLKDALKEAIEWYIDNGYLE